LGFATESHQTGPTEHIYTLIYSPLRFEMF